MEFVVDNPSDEPLLMQVLPLAVYPYPQVMVDLLANRFTQPLAEYVEMDDPDVFFLPEASRVSACVLVHIIMFIFHFYPSLNLNLSILGKNEG